MNLPDARTRALALRELLAPACERIEVAGSIRRGKPEVKDAEIVAIPKTYEVETPGLFGPTSTERRSLLWDTIDDVIAGGDSLTVHLMTAELRQATRAWREEVPEDVETRGLLTRHPPIGERAAPWGDRYRKLVWAGLPVDLFTATPDTWGAIAVIRTGPAAFSQEWVTAIRRYGYRMEGGVVRDEGGALVPVPDEAAAFGLAGWAYLPARERGAGPCTA